MAETKNAENKSDSGESGLLSSLFRFRRGWKGLLTLWLVLLPLKVWRAQEENSFWVDEIYSVLMAHRPFSELIYYDAQHDNFYFIALKIWSGIGGVFPWIPKLFWARLLNVLFWTLFSVIAWFGSRRLLGDFNGAVLSWAVLSGAMVAHLTKETRSYATPSFALFLCFLVIVALWKNIHIKGAQANSPPRRKVSSVLWVIYVMCALVAVSHNLLGILLLSIMTMSWFFLGVDRKGGRLAFFIPGVIAHGLIGILCVFWLVFLSRNILDMQYQDRLWMTPCTIGNFLRVFFLWFPLGQTPFTRSSGWMVIFYIMGGASFILPWGFALLSGIFVKSEQKDDAFLLKTALLTFIISIYFVLLLFLLDSIAGIKVFHGPRYPSVVAPIWSWGLAAAALWARQRVKGRHFLTIIALTPWLLCSFFGQFLTMSLEARSGLYQWRRENENFFPERGGDLYVFPAELIPYFPRNLKDYSVKNLEELETVSENVRDVFILDLNNWKNLRAPRDAVIMRLIQNKLLSHGVAIKEYSPKFSPFRNYVLLDYKREAARDLIPYGAAPSPRAFPSNLLAAALPEDQKSYEGWAVLEIDKQQNSFRWGSGDVSIMRFDRPLESGDYTLRLAGFRHPYPSKQIRMKFRIKGEKEENSVLQDHGFMNISVSLRLTRKHKAPKLIIEQPAWRPSDHIDGSPDGRHLSFLFLRAWIE